MLFRSVEDCALDVGMFDQLQSGYVKRGNDALPRQGSKHPWKVLMHYGKDSRMLLNDPVEDTRLQFDKAAVDAAVA